MSHRILALTLGAGGLILAAAPAATANPICAGRTDVLAGLANGYGETKRSMGLAGENAFVEIFASDRTGSWTIIVTTPNGVSCLIASGEGYETITEQTVAGNPV